MSSRHFKPPFRLAGFQDTHKSHIAIIADATDTIIARVELLSACDAERIAVASLFVHSPQLLESCETSAEQCGCSIQQREGGHRIDCIAPQINELINIVTSGFGDPNDTQIMLAMEDGGGM